jgi:5-methylcytosine-specific restriction endonuclease McrA/predicted transcriptional regulator
MIDLLPLPEPESEELESMLPGRTHRDLYSLLYETRGVPLTAVELRHRFTELYGDQSQLDRRRRDLYRLFFIEQIRTVEDSSPRYALRGRLAKPRHEVAKISARVRAEVLRFGRCRQCGRTPVEHGVVLVVDHKMPQAWGGTHDIENLQALCEECNAGKKDYYETFDRYGSAIVLATRESDVHRRLASLLLSVSPDEVRSDVLELVANLGETQEDWQKRLRELRELNWDYAVRKERDERGRVRVYYRLTSHADLPSGPLRSSIRAAELRKRAEASETRSPKV